ncbi:MAG TPA: hypothetical protein DHW82_12720 [Spirochaetia bacterium]|nr:MAG: hypothetical protein A2Y41_03185 [Spirochaetes bacterium GWB1_36_13]HCL57853.1 hypothetical protein [Spirochaetia bacterium]
MKTLKSLFSFLFIIGLISGCSGNSAIVKKGEAFKNEKQKVITFSVFDFTAKKAITDDPVMEKYEGLIASTVGDLYGELISGGAVITKLADELGVKDKLDMVMGKITEFVLNSGNQGLGDLRDVLIKLAEKAGVDAFAFPLASGGKGNLITGQKIVLYLVIYDLKTDKLQFVAHNEAAVSSMVITGAQGDQDKLTKLAESQVLSATNDMIEKIKKELFQ